MLNTETKQKTEQLMRILIVVGIVFVSFNLRPAMTSVGPLLGMIRLDLGLEHWSVALLTSLPLLAFAFMSSIVPHISSKISNERLMVIGLIVLIIGISVRSVSLKTMLFGGTILVGIGIAVCNVLLPSVVKDKFPNKVGLMTSVYSTIMGSFAAIASGLSAPFAAGLGWGWQFALLFWVVPALLGLIVWIMIARKNNEQTEEEAHYIQSSNFDIWKSPLAWQVALFMGLQSALFYVTISWLPEILQDSGLDITTAGWMLSYTQFIGLPFGFIVPVLAGKMRTQHMIVVVLGFLSLAGFSGLLFAKSFFFIAISATLIGVTIGSTFPLALTFLAMRARNAKHASELSGMAQAIGYLIAAMGPTLMGLLYDITESWNIPIIVLLGVTVLVIIFGLGASQNEYVLDEKTS